MIFSTSRLKRSPVLHLRPIKVVIYNQSMKSNLVAGFALICFQRLSELNIATQQCPW
jgi:hypothetical protein